MQVVGCGDGAVVDAPLWRAALALNDLSEDGGCWVLCGRDRVAVLGKLRRYGTTYGTTCSRHH